MRLRLILKLRSPVSISQGHTVAGDTRRTLDYISGTALRGALAFRYLQLPGHRDDSGEFRALFLGEEVRFVNLYPGSNGSLPLPLTARSCKRRAGFKPSDKGGHGAADGLLCFAALHLQGDDLPDCLDHCGERECPGAMDRYGGFYFPPDPNAGDREFKRVEPHKRLLSRTALSSQRGAAQMGALFTLEALEEEEEFAGIIEVPDALSSKLCFLLPQDATFSLGTARTRGLGLVGVEDCTEIEGPYPLAGSLNERIERFQAKATGILDGGDKNYVALTLWSDAIVLDELMRYQSWIDELVLKRESQRWGSGKILPPEGLRLRHHACATRHVSGWHLKRGFPKDDELAIAMGSTFLFEYPKGEEDRLVSWLSALEGEGIGERRNEGFGKVIACHPFHQEVEPV